MSGPRGGKGPGGARKAGPSKGAPSRGGPRRGGPQNVGKGNRGAARPEPPPRRSSTGRPNKPGGGSGRGRGRGSGQRGTSPLGNRDGGDGPKGLGGDQVEGRQAVRELLLAGTRRTREVVLAGDLDPAPILDDIIDLADEAKVTIREVSRNKFESMTRTEAAQGVLALAQPLQEYELDDLLVPDAAGRDPFLLLLDGVTDPGTRGLIPNHASRVTTRDPRSVFTMWRPRLKRCLTPSTRLITTTVRRHLSDYQRYDRAVTVATPRSSMNSRGPRPRHLEGHHQVQPR